MSRPNSPAAWAAPRTISAGAWSPPMASTAIRMWPSSDVEVADALGVRLDELLARLDVGTHQFFERVVDRCDVVYRHLKQDASRRVHRRLPEFLRVHLAQTLHSRRLGALAELTHRLVAVSLGLAPDDLHVLAGALRHFEERRLRHVEVTHVDHLGEIAEEEREQKGADVTAVDVCIGHRHDAVVADLLDVEVVADARAHGRDEVAD